MRTFLQHPPRSPQQRGFVVALITMTSFVFGQPQYLPATDEPTHHSQVTSLIISPAQIKLGGWNLRQQVLVTAQTTEGNQFDVTHLCHLTTQDHRLALLDGSRVIAKSDGQTNLIAKFGGTQTSVEVSVNGCESPPPVHFQRDIIPLLAKLRCNGSGCHGKQSGQNGFRLSIFGFDPRGDFDALTKEARGRRVFPGDPNRSLVISKASGLTPHGGGRRTEPASDDIELFRRWIIQGARWGDENAAHLESIEVKPTERIMKMRDRQQILVTALYSDGSHRDVTTASSYASNMDVVADVTEPGSLYTGTTPGEAAITIQYMGQVAVTRILVPQAASTDSFDNPPIHNQIDDLVWQKLQKLRIQPSGICDDTTFLRRLFLDTIGTLPTPQEVEEFLDNTHPEKRSEKIRDVLSRSEFADFWALKWSDVLLVNSQALGARGALQFHHWIRQQMRENRPYDEWVREILTATGNTGKYGPVNFYRAAVTTNEVTKTIGQAFLGIRLDCAQCHHHPFEKWGQEDFYGLAAYFTGLQRKQLSADRDLVFHAGYRPATIPVLEKSVPARTLGGAAVESFSGDPRVPLADWLTSPDNPWFARLVANRLWKHFLGRGIVEPEDDLRSTNPATNEPLLDYLAGQVVALNFDLQAVMRLILNSRVYQLSSETNETNFNDQQNFSHHITKRLAAEILLDAICEVTGSPERFSGQPLGTRSIELWDNRLPSYFLDTFGRSPRESPCECGKSNDPTMAQALHLMNAPEIEAKIADPQGRIAQLLETQATPDQIVRNLCLTALNRFPTERETQIAKKLFEQQEGRLAAEDFLWTLLNSYDFLFIH
ncbi:MAG: DUF1549 and DUF1553 domain-containing protein [Pirellulaceae bacterium]|nr:DUF1549 and DUF1553 domain-containing protein [Pirellulaceae bacterium]